MNRAQYQAARATVRANGLYALRWLDETAALVFQRLDDIKQIDDMLALRGRFARTDGPATAVRLTCPCWMLDEIHARRTA